MVPVMDRPKFDDPRWIVTREFEDADDSTWTQAWELTDADGTVHRVQESGINRRARLGHPPEDLWP